MSDVRIVLNSAGIRELLKSPEIQQAIEEVCTTVAANAGDGYGHNVQVGKNRTVGRVYTATKTAKIDNYTNNTLLKALHM